MKKGILVFVFLVFSFAMTLHVNAMVVSDSVSLETISWKVFDDDDVVEGVTLEQDYCADPDFIKPFIFLGRIFSIIKILIPILIIAFGMIDFFKAVIASKDDEIKKSMRSLMFRAVAGVVIFFIPTIVHLLFLLIDDWKQYETSYSKCSLCISSPSKCK